MRWLESQIDTRARLDAELTERAYAELAASVSSAANARRLHVDDLGQADGAIKTCLRYVHAQPGDVPDVVTDLEGRIEWLCRPSGTMYRKVRLEVDWYKRAFGAMLGKLDTGESVALLPRGPRGYSYIDPQTGKRVRVSAKTASRIDAEAIIFYPPLPARPLKVQDFISFIIAVFDTTDYLLVLIATLAVTLIGLLPAWANSIAFDMVIPSANARLVLPIGALLAGVAISKTLINSCRNFVMARVVTKLRVSSEAATFARVLALPTPFFKEFASGDLASRVSSMNALTQNIATMMLGALLSLVLSFVYVIQIAFYTPMLALPALVVIVLESLLTIVVTQFTMRYEKMAMEASMKLSGTVTALLGGIQKIKLAGAEDRAFAKWARGYAKYARTTYNRPPVLLTLPALVTLVGILGNIVIYYLAGSARVSIADYMAFNMAYGQATAAVAGLASIASQVATIKPTLELAAPILEATPELAEGKPSVESLSGAIDVSSVSFRYNEDTPYILRNLSFRVRSGEYVAIVGKSGCGKSTLLRLMLGFEKPESGAIFYGPHDVQKVNLRSLRQHIGTVMQDGRLFMGDIASNITISTPGATLDDAWEAAEIAGAADDIRKMPMGMQTIVTEGSGGVSGGQRQRLMIARAVCGKRRILMFDEATSALDNVTQKHVSDSLEQLKCTRIVVAHRLSTVRHCDRILVVDEGRIAEEGSYEELIAKNGLFAELVKRQRLEEE